MRHEAHAVGVPRAGDHEDEVQEEGCPTDHKHPQEDGERHGSLHVGGLPDGATGAAVAGDGQSGNALEVQPRQQEHVDVQGGHQRQHGEEHPNEEDEDGHALRVDDEEDAGGSAEGPDARHRGHGPPARHDGVVAQGVEDGDVAVHGHGQQTPDRGQERGADHGVEQVVHALHEAATDTQASTGEERHGDGLRGVGDADEHVCHGQAADEEVHGRVQVAVLHHCCHHQNVLHKAEDA